MLWGTVDSGPSGLGISPGRVHCSVFIGAQVYKYVEVNLALQWTSIYLRRRGNKNTVVTWPWRWTPVREVTLIYA